MFFMLHLNTQLPFHPSSDALFFSSQSVYFLFFLLFLCRKEFCELCLAKDRQTQKVFVCKKFLKKDGRKVRKAAKNEIMILKLYVIGPLTFG